MSLETISVKLKDLNVIIFETAREFENARDPLFENATLEIVCNYLSMASDDGLRLAMAIADAFVTDNELQRLTDVFERSMRKFHRAHTRWKEMCLH